MGVTEVAPSSLEKHNAIAMASKADGHGGTGGDLYISKVIELQTSGRVTKEQGIATASSILSQHPEEEKQTQAEILIVDHGGVIMGSELNGVIFQAEHEEKVLSFPEPVPDQEPLKKAA